MEPAATNVLLGETEAGIPGEAAQRVTPANFDFANIWHLLWVCIQHLLYKCKHSTLNR